MLFEIVGDAKAAPFREVSQLVREWKEGTRAAVQVLCEGLYGGGKGVEGGKEHAEEGKVAEGPGSMSRL